MTTFPRVYSNFSFGFDFVTYWCLLYDDIYCFWGGTTALYVVAFWRVDLLTLVVLAFFSVVAQCQESVCICNLLPVFLFF